MSEPSNLPSVGVVGHGNALARRIRKALAATPIKLAFAASTDEVDDTAAASKAQVVLVESSLDPEQSSAFRRVRDLFTHARVIACVPETKEPVIRWALENGAAGVIWDHRLEETLEATIRVVHAGQFVAPLNDRGMLSPPDFTNREKQVLSLIIMGMTNREIADKLFISESTVKSHLNSSYHKLGVNSRVEAIRRITDSSEGLGMGILAITPGGLSRGRSIRGGDNA